MKQPLPQLRPPLHRAITALVVIQSVNVSKINGLYNTQMLLVPFSSGAGRHTFIHYCGAFPFFFFFVLPVLVIRRENGWCASSHEFVSGGEP